MQCNIWKFVIVCLLPLCAFSAGLENAAIAKWICSAPDLCLLANETAAATELRYESQNDCRLSCGRFGAIWPAPTGQVSLSNRRIRFDPWKIVFNIAAPSAASTQFLQEAERIFLRNIMMECRQNCSLVNSAEVLVKTTVNSSSLILDWTTDESYNLSITTTTAGRTFVKIRANTVYGARHGFETLSNMIAAGKNAGLLMVSTATVADGPVFAHRGVLLDTSRHFIPLRQIRNILNAMAVSKMNVFHWHVVDTHSFPLEITRVPQMQRYGAYSEDQTYSRNDAQNIVRYARLRGIRVLIEIDGPSHAGNGWQWGPAAGFGNMSIGINAKPWSSCCMQPPCGQLNPFNEHMYATLKEIYADLAELNAPEESIHFGGDEVYIPCWNNSEEIRNGMKTRGFDLSLNSYYRVCSQFHERNLNAWDAVNEIQYPQNKVPKSVVVWSSPLTDPSSIESYLPKERFIIQTWVDSSSSLNRQLLDKGYQIIISNTDAWYLDIGTWGESTFNNWKTIYNNKMPSGKGVLGGEVCMWSEFVDGNGVEARIWPKAGGAAERLWSNLKSGTSVARRFYRYHDRLVTRGVHSDTIIPKWCVYNEGQCVE